MITLAEIKQTREQIAPYVVETPVWQWRNSAIKDVIGSDIDLFLKMELWQHTGTFKPRGALSVMLALDQAALQRGVTAVSAGNHAIATGYAAQILGTTAKVVMPKYANPERIAKCRAFGAEVVLVDDVHKAFDEVKRIEREEGRTFVHPFEGPLTVRGTATVGLEFCQQVPNLDAVIVAIGGGGLCAGVATAVKLLQPQCRVYGVEPAGADTMHRSFASGKPEAIDAVRTIADSLGAPHAAPYTFAVCQKYVDELVRVSDDELRQAMRLLFAGMRLAVEPAGAAAVAALCGSLHQKLKGQRVGIVLSGTNIDLQTYTELLIER